jgi:hypothetical protein
MDSIPEVDAETLAAILGAIRDGATAWSTADEIAELLEADRSDVLEQLGTLIRIGMVAEMGDDPPTFTLTPLAASGLNLEIRERGIGSRPYWADRRSLLARVRYGATDDETFAELVDQNPSPEELAIKAEEARGWKPKGPFDVDRLPRPSRLLYHDGNPWDEGHGTCGTCQGRRLSNDEYCLDCSRWGFDWLVAKHRRLAEERAASAAHAS